MKPRTGATAAGTAERILLIDSDTELAQFVDRTLRAEGFAVSLAASPSEALAHLTAYRPDLILLDAADAVEITRKLRADPFTASLPIIIVTARGLTVDKVIALTAGADDYIVKPFDTWELVARVRATLRRNREVRESSPLTGLPGNVRILAEISARVERGQEFALCYIDIDRFKSVNDAYGFVRGDEFISLLARCLHGSVERHGAHGVFLGHVGGDDFLLLCPAGLVDDLIGETVQTFENRSRELYDPVDAARGYLETMDRRGRPHRSDLLTLSVGVAVSGQRWYDDPRELVALSTEMKLVAKSHHGSYVAIDRRRLAS